MRYQVQRTTDGMGAVYATGPLALFRTDDLAQAQREVMARGGVVIDAEKSAAMLPDDSWVSLEDFSEGSGRRYEVQ